MNLMPTIDNKEYESRFKFPGISTIKIDNIRSSNLKKNLQAKQYTNKELRN